MTKALFLVLIVSLVVGSFWIYRSISKRRRREKLMDKVQILLNEGRITVNQLIIFRAHVYENRAVLSMIGYSDRNEAVLAVYAALVQRFNLKTIREVM